MTNYYPDLINAAFEGLGTFFVYLNIRRIQRDKIVRGVDWRVMAFFTTWGFWNIFYYPHLGQWSSFVAGISLVIVNVMYLSLMLYYVRQERVNDKD